MQGVSGFMLQDSGSQTGGEDNNLALESSPFPAEILKRFSSWRHFLQH